MTSMLVETSMHESPERNFGLLIAYVVPGFVCLAGACRFSELVSAWMAVSPTGAPSVGGFLYVAVGSLAAGLVVNAFRWAVLDSAFHFTGLVPPRLDFTRLQSRMDAFQLAVEHNYRYYQFYGATALAAGFYAAADISHAGLWSAWKLIGSAILEAVLLLTARDCLKRYYERTRQILGNEGPSVIDEDSALPSQTP